jgi:hypothetical protein
MPNKSKEELIFIDFSLDILYANLLIIIEYYKK